jgi:DNA-binding LacI/PurR family transcriptional regulator
MVARERLRGYAEAVEAAGIAFEDLPVVEAGGFSTSAARAAAETLLSVRPDVTAILATSDVMAFGVLDVLRKHGIPVPRRVSVVGFDDIPASVDRGLTTVQQPIREKGRCAATMLLDAIAGRPTESVTLPWTLVERDTTAEPRRR